MKKIYYFISMYVCITGICCAQANFKPGYVIFQSGDTLTGYIKIKTESRSSLLCEFRDTEESDSRFFTPADIMQYHVDNQKLYISKNIELNDSSMTVFLEYLVDGIVDLYYLKEPETDYYFIDKEGKLYQLSNDRKIIEKGYYSVPYETTSNQYIGMLTLLFSDAPEILSSVNNTDYGFKSLINITKDYHDYVCTDYACIDYTKMTKTWIWIEPGAGFTWSNVSLKKIDKKVTEYSPNFGITFRFKPGKSYYWNFVTGLHYTANITFNDDWLDVDLYNVTKDYHVDMKYSLLRIPFQAEYYLSLKKIQPCLFGGINAIFIVKTAYNIKMLYEYGEETLMGTKYSDLQIGFTGGAGLRANLKNNYYLLARLGYEIMFPEKDAPLLENTTRHTVFTQLGFGFRIR